jgi:hypothetical protein
MKISLLVFVKAKIKLIFAEIINFRENVHVPNISAKIFAKISRNSYGFAKSLTSLCRTSFPLSCNDCFSLLKLIFSYLVLHILLVMLTCTNFFLSHSCVESFSHCFLPLAAHLCSCLILIIMEGHRS